MPNFARAGRCAGIAAALLLIANTGLQTATAEGDTRTLSFHHVHTGEDLTVTFKHSGRYDDAALAKLNWFMRDWRRDEETKMDPHLFDLLWEAYREVGGREPVQVICGFRSSDTNSMLRARSSGVAQFSLHTQGDAIDFYIPGVDLEKVREVGLRMQRGGVGFYPSSGSPFVHLDTGSVRHWPRMTHDQLVKVFPNERTVHIPSDGQPLAGYAMALADIERQGKEPNSVSLAAARNAGVIGEDDRTASVPQKRGMLASLFGFGKQDEGSKPSDKPKTPAREAVAVASARVNPPIQVAVERIVPLPKGRPVAVAAVTPTPAPRPMAVASLEPNLFANRGLWPAVEVGSPLSPPIELASADPLTTASASSALGYAPANQPAPARRVSPMGAAVPRLVRPANAGEVEPDHGAIAQAGTHFEGPWLRAMILTPSTASMSVTQLGTTDPRPLAEFLRKPTSSVLMSFAAGPHDSMRSDSFSGRAVVFLATATFGVRTASLVP